MDKKFNLAVEIVKEHLKSNQYSYGITMSYLRCYRLLSTFFDENKYRYNKQLADQWLQSFGYNLCKPTRNTYNLALKKLDMSYRGKEIGNTKELYEKHQNYQRLESWAKSILDVFLKETCSMFTEGFIRQIRNSVAKFLNYLSDNGGSKPEDITHLIIIDFYRDDEHDSYKSKDVCNNCIRKFLKYLSNKGIIQSSITLTLDKFALKRLVFINTLSKDEQNAFKINNAIPTISATAFYETALQMHPVLDDNKYSKSVKKPYRLAWRELFIFLEANSLEYSINIAIAWAAHMRIYTTQWKSFRRAMMLFEQFRVNGQIDPQIVYTYKPDRLDGLPQWCKDEFESFYQLKEKEGYAKSTLDMSRSSCLRLFEYLHETGVNSWNEVTPERLKDFHCQDSHSTAEGKNAYSSKIRIFLEYLGDIGVVHPALFMAVPSEAAARVNIIDTLNEDEIKDIYQFSDNSTNAMILRHSAMVLIGLRMGIRAIDIAKLKFTDVSWEQKTISIQQQKRVFS